MPDAAQLAMHVGGQVARCGFAALASNLAPDMYGTWCGVRHQPLKPKP